MQTAAEKGTTGALSIIVVNVNASVFKHLVLLATGSHS